MAGSVVILFDFDRTLIEDDSDRWVITKYGSERIVPPVPNAYHGTLSWCDLKVVSDSNLFYIKTILEHNGVYNCFSEITTNPALVDGGRLRIFPYHDAASSHGCDLCPPTYARFGKFYFHASKSIRLCTCIQPRLSPAHARKKL
ncbi:Inorganic pyrophosphatase 2 [Sesamum angolense]|uniref:Inorganic pyrophosphatase 2 n=1 Tax=Sesamum angolense TaxID=2727404 RepID=A0AAE1T521_9LAMI|nr:Inorganic pyrophosphatase 2 [Sesamum angolense]